MIESLETLADSETELLDPEDEEDLKKNGALSVLPGSNLEERWDYRPRLNPYLHFKNLFEILSHMYKEYRDLYREYRASKPK